jgi:uncharacterized protein YkwD
VPPKVSKEGDLVLRHAIVVLVVVVVTTFGLLFVTAADPNEAEAASAVKTCDGGKIRLNAKEERVFHLQNRARRRRHLSPLCVHPMLTKAAHAHSADMIRKDYFRHGNTGRRLKHFGYRWSDYGENIAWGSGRRGSPENVFKRWMNSQAHRSNILDRKVKEVGIGTATGTFKGIKRVTMYTVDFGTRR